jgi:hypothetical protein
MSFMLFAQPSPANFPVDQIAAAFDCLQQGGHFGKIALRF